VEIESQQKPTKQEEEKTKKKRSIIKPPSILKKGKKSEKRGSSIPTKAERTGRDSEEAKFKKPLKRDLRRSSEKELELKAEDYENYLVCTQSEEESKMESSERKEKKDSSDKVLLDNKNIINTSNTSRRYSTRRQSMSVSAASHQKLKHKPTLNLKHNVLSLKKRRITDIEDLDHLFQKNVKRNKQN
jgi:hypothetical protein